jgi:Zn finger protein HypA/HybF involved in hydrogenase expression
MSLPDDIKEIGTNLHGLVERHLQDQPFSCECEECGNALSTSVSLDSDFDLNVVVSPCETCLSEARGES